MKPSQKYHLEQIEKAYADLDNALKRIKVHTKNLEEDLQW